MNKANYFVKTSSPHSPYTLGTARLRASALPRISSLLIKFDLVEK